jgi:hypothetical protein
MGELFDSWLRKFEEDGEETVRMKISAGVFSQTHKEAAEGWLKSKAVVREDQSRQDKFRQDTLASQAEANAIASAAKSAAERAADAASRSADAASRSAAATEAASKAADR